MAIRNFNRVDYGLTNALQSIQAAPIVAQRAPSTSDRGEIGQVWVHTTTNNYYILTSIVSNISTWTLAGDGSGIFTSVEATTGDITADQGDIIATLGDIIASAGDINATLGAVNAGTSVTAGTTITAGTGITATTGDIVASAGSIIATAGTISTTNDDIEIGNTDAASTASELGFLKSRSGGIITTGDDLGYVVFRGHDGVAYVDSASIISRSSGTIGVDRIPSDLEFYTHPDAATPTEQRMIIASTGAVTINEPDSGNSLTLAGTTQSVIAASGTNVSLYLNSVGSGGTGQTRPRIGGVVELFNVNSNNTDPASSSMVSSTVGGTSAGDAFFQALISGGQVFSWGIDNSTANDNFVISKAAALGTTNILSFDGTSNAATFAAGITATTGDITCTAGDVVISTAAKGVSLPGAVKLLAGAGDPNAAVTAAQGSLFLRTDGSSTSTRAYINTDGVTAWTSVTTAA